jgi:hypothetical protein
MAEITKITNYKERAILRLIEQYKEKPILKDILDAFSEEVQEAENAINSSFGKLDIDNNSNNQLDKIGDIVGERRSGKDDTSYRLAIKARIAINTSTGTAEEIISIFKLFTGATKVQYFDLYPAAIQIMGNVPIPVEIEDVLRFAIESSLVAGVRLELIGSFDDTEAFEFAETDGTFGLGFGDEGDPNVGGKLGEEF